MTQAPERQVYDSRIGIEIPLEKVLAGDNESEAAGKKLIRAKWLNDGRGEKARDRQVAMEIAAFEGKRDDNHVMAPPLKSCTNAGLQSGDRTEGSTTRLGYPRLPSRIRPRASIRSHATWVCPGMWLCCGELCTVHDRRSGCGRMQSVAP